jgi:hypothetical protein
MLREQLMMFSKINPAVLATLFFGLTLSGSALACSTDGWDSESGMVAVGQPFGATPPDINGVARFEEFCALVAAGTGYVQTNAPSHSEVTNRFYVWADVSGTGDADILVGYSAENGTGELFSIAYDGTNFDFASSGGSDSAAAADGWNLIEYHWNGTTFEYWVNADATTDSWKPEHPPPETAILSDEPGGSLARMRPTRRTARSVTVTSRGVTAIWFIRPFLHRPRSRRGGSAKDKNRRDK